MLNFRDLRDTVKYDERILDPLMAGGVMLSQLGMCIPPGRSRVRIDNESGNYFHVFTLVVKRSTVT